jgi:hypothetical protein
MLLGTLGQRLGQLSKPHKQGPGEGSGMMHACSVLSGQHAHPFQALTSHIRHGTAQSQKLPSPFVAHKDSTTHKTAASHTLLTSMKPSELPLTSMVPSGENMATSGCVLAPNVTLAARLLGYTSTSSRWLAAVPLNRS